MRHLILSLSLLIACDTSQGDSITPTCDVPEGTILQGCSPGRTTLVNGITRACEIAQGITQVCIFVPADNSYRIVFAPTCEQCPESVVGE